MNDKALALLGVVGVVAWAIAPFSFRVRRDLGPLVATAWYGIPMLVFLVWSKP